MRRAALGAGHGGELLEAIDRVLDTGEPLTERDLSVTLNTDRARVVDS